MKTIAGTIGFAMLFVVPSEVTWAAIGRHSVWLAAAIVLLAYAGAFKHLKTKKKRHKNGQTNTHLPRIVP